MTIIITCLLEQQMPCFSVAWQQWQHTEGLVMTWFTSQPPSLKGEAIVRRTIRHIQTYKQTPRLMWLPATFHTTWDSWLSRMSTKVTVTIGPETADRCGLLQLDQRQVWLQVPDEVLLSKTQISTCYDALDEFSLICHLLFIEKMRWTHGFGSVQ